MRYKKNELILRNVLYFNDFILFFQMDNVLNKILNHVFIMNNRVSKLEKKCFIF